MATSIKTPCPETQAADNSEIVAVYVWQWPVRIFHWIMVLSLIVLTFTGFYMHNPFLVATGPRAWVMGTMRFVHELFGFILMSVVILRIYWFFVGNHWSRWRAWLPITREQWRSIGSMLLYYTYRRRAPFPEIGHNSLATSTYLIVGSLLVVECVTGTVLYSVVRGSHLLTLLVGWIPRIVDIQYIRATHYFLMFLFMAFIIHHVYSAVLVSMESHNGLMESIFSGWKFVPRRLLEEKAAGEEVRIKETSRAPRHEAEAMIANDSRSVAVLGLGNPMRTDDGVGIYAIRQLSEDHQLPSEVQVIEGGTLGLELLHSLQGVTHLLVLDAVDTGAVPGTLSRFANSELDSVPIARSVHLLGLADLLGSMKLLGDAPDEVVLLGIQPESTDWGVALSPRVNGALNQLSKSAVTQLQAWMAPLASFSAHEAN